MSLSIEIQKKPKVIEEIKLEKSSEVFDLEEVQEIKDAVQEHLLFIGLDRGNNGSYENEKFYKIRICRCNEFSARLYKAAII